MLDANEVEHDPPAQARLEVMLARWCPTTKGEEGEGLPGAPLQRDGKEGREDGGELSGRGESKQAACQRAACQRAACQRAACQRAAGQRAGRRGFYMSAGGKERGLHVSGREGERATCQQAGRREGCVSAGGKERGLR